MDLVDRLLRVGVSQCLADLPPRHPDFLFMAVEVAGNAAELRRADNLKIVHGLTSFYLFCRNYLGGCGNLASRPEVRSDTVTASEIAKEIVIAMINKGSVPYWSFVGDEQADKLAVTNAKAVAAAYEVVYAGIVESNSKSR